jgi:dTDP-4-amino-4,6-dideoxygalactose transaminase
MNVPFVDLKIQYKLHKYEIDHAIAAVLRESQFVHGKAVGLFEKEFASYLKARYCIAMNSGTDALILGFRALELSSGDEVIVSANTYIATALGASENGLKPVFVDCDPTDYGLDLSDLKKKITSRTKAIIAVHLFGQPEKIEEIQKIIRASGKKIYLVEDACQAHGAMIKGKKVGTFGIFSAFSFYPGKNLGAYGDGGAVVTGSSLIAGKLRMLREYGQKRKYFHQTRGVNSRLDTIQAAILLAKLPYLNRWNARRQEMARYYTKHLSGIVEKTPVHLADRKSVFHLYVVEVARRDALIAELKKNDITTLIHYPVPLHLSGTYKYLGYKRGDFPQAEHAANHLISLPMFPELTRKQADFVIKTIRKYYA